MSRTFSFFGRRGGQDQAQMPRPTDPQPKKTNSKDEYIFKSVSEKYKEITGIKSAHSEKPGLIFSLGCLPFPLTSGH